jgi:hypothetical protein
LSGDAQQIASSTLQDFVNWLSKQGQFYGCKIGNQSLVFYSSLRNAMPVLYWVGGAREIVLCYRLDQILPRMGCSRAFGFGIQIEPRIECLAMKRSSSQGNQEVPMCKAIE